MIAISATSNSWLRTTRLKCCAALPFTSRKSNWSLRVRNCSVTACSPMSVLSMLVLRRAWMSAADGRRDNLVRDVEIPDRRGVARAELRYQLRQAVQGLERLPRQAETARDAGEVAVAEHRAVFGQSFRAQLVHFRPIRAVVHYDDEDVQPVALDGLEFLHVHHQAAVAVEQHHFLVGAGRRHAHGERDAVADRAELANSQELLLRARRHLREEPRAVAAGIHHLPVA